MPIASYLAPNPIKGGIPWGWLFLKPATGVSPTRGSMPERVPLSREERRLRRAARREKQRQANIGRARKMHLARVGNERSGNSQALAIQDEKRQLYVACSGWFY
jgi:hypothetical protein